MYRRDGDVLLRANTLGDELHTRVPLLLKTKLTSILPSMITVCDSSVKVAFPLLMSSKNAPPHSTIAVMYHISDNYRAERLCSREDFREPFGRPSILAGVPGLKDLDGRPNKPTVLYACQSKSNTQLSIAIQHAGDS